MQSAGPESFPGEGRGPGAEGFPQCIAPEPGERRAWAPAFAGEQNAFRMLVAEGRKIEAIKRLRAATLTSLADAKAMVDRLGAGPG